MNVLEEPILRVFETLYSAKKEGNQELVNYIATELAEAISLKNGKPVEEIREAFGYEEIVKSRR